MILIVTNREDYTSDYLITKLQERGVKYLRFNTEDFPFSGTARLTPSSASIELEKSKKVVNMTDIKAVWYRRPQGPVFPPGFDQGTSDFVSRESREFLHGIWRTLDCLWVNHPDKIRFAENKIEQLNRMKRLGLKIH